MSPSRSSWVIVFQGNFSLFLPLGDGHPPPQPRGELTFRLLIVEAERGGGGARLGRLVLGLEPLADSLLGLPHRVPLLHNLPGKLNLFLRGGQGQQRPAVAGGEVALLNEPLDLLGQGQQPAWRWPPRGGICSPGGRPPPGSGRSPG